jgi:hypothetical protein
LHGTSGGHVTGVVQLSLAVQSNTHALLPASSHAPPCAAQPVVSHLTAGPASASPSRMTFESVMLPVSGKLAPTFSLASVSPGLISEPIPSNPHPAITPAASDAAPITHVTSRNRRIRRIVTKVRADRRAS